MRPIRGISFIPVCYISPLFAKHVELKYYFHCTGTNFHSPFSNVILRVIRAPRPSLEDLILQLFAPDDVATQPVAAEDYPFAHAENDASASATDSTPGFDLSERIAREMQEQEDREQEMRDRATALRNQFGEFISSMFGNSQSEIGSVAPMFHQERVNAEAGVSRTST
jgi:hypothetical protein